jgi:hypothetical protein
MYVCILILGPTKAVFTFQPSPSYTCNYAEGEFIPTTVPKCSFGKLKTICKSISIIKSNNFIKPTEK